VPAGGSVGERAAGFLVATGCAFEAEHSAAVALEAGRIAGQFDLDPEQAADAAWLHDISAPIPADERIALAESLDIAVLPEERRFPMIVHQRISVVMARDLFGIEDPSVLSAIGCHTTLKPDASALDMAVFVADKIAWDQPGQPPYLPKLQAALEASLAAASLIYLDYLWHRQAELPVLHPWAVAAYHALRDDGRWAHARQ
jgi:predicted HD superfamily hydrolase involved in NAD metabolism